jgi:S-DNA-T family DNA segregation ATPase FtsK/SpoIIIE
VSLLGASGAEKLLGNGAMLFKSPDKSDPVYIQGAYMSAGELRHLVDYVASKPHDFSKKFTISDDMLSHEKGNFTEDVSISRPATDNRKELTEIILWVLSHDKISVSQIKAQFRMGNRADDAMDTLFRLGIVSDKFANLPRDVLPKSTIDLSQEVMELMRAYGIAEDVINTAFQAR